MNAIINLSRLGLLPAFDLLRRLPEVARWVTSGCTNTELEAILDSAVKGHVALIEHTRCFDGTPDYPHLDRVLETMRRKNTYHTEVSTDIIRLTPKNLTAC